MFSIPTLPETSVFNYRMELGLTNLHSSYEDTYGFPFSQYTYTAWEDSLALTTVHYFGFGVVRTRNVRLWLGPQITFGGWLTNKTGVYAGIGFAIGLNINIGDVFTLAFTGAGRFLGGAIIDTDSEGYYYTTGGYGVDGMVTMAFMFRFPGDRIK